MSVHSSVSQVSSSHGIPNLPGVRKSAAATNPKLYKEFMLSKSQSALLEDTVFGNNGLEDDHSVADSFLDASIRLQELHSSKSLSAFPSQGGSYNDLSGRYSLRSQQQDRLSKSMSLPYCSLESVPAFVSNTDRTCRFIAYYDEDTPENLLELTRSRKVEIIYYTDDDTIEINEPRVKNSGLVQGKILKRHKIVKNAKRSKLPPMSEDNVVPEVPFFALSDFYAGAELVIYNKSYFIIDCDHATYQYLEDLGSPFGSPLSLPTSFYQPNPRGANIKSASHKGAKSFKASDFFEYDKKTLRFFALWDNRKELFGDKIMVRIHYSLADQLFEVVPIHERNCGRDRIPKKLEKDENNED